MRCVRLVGASHLVGRPPNWSLPNGCLVLEYGTVVQIGLNSYAYVV